MQPSGDHFYITLPSDSSVHMHGEQGPSNYITELAKNLQLKSDNWEAGLAELTYTKTWPNVTGCKATVLHQRRGLHTKRAVIDIPIQQMSHGVELTDKLQQMINDALGTEGQKQNITVRFDNETKKAAFTFESGFGLELNKALANILGFGDQTRVTIGNFIVVCTSEVSQDGIHSLFSCESVWSVQAINLNANFPNLFVYTDIIEHQLVGDSYSPLLRTVSVTDDDVSHNVTVTFHDIHYCNVQRSNINNIHIRLCDHYGTDISFRSGRVIAKLHFRRR